MLQQILCGNLGADAQLKEKDGRKFTTFRVAHNDAWTDGNGQRHDNTIWVDCIINDHPKVAEYLKAGQQVIVIGTVSLRVYSSEKDRCMKAGMTINVQRIELVGGQGDAVPSRLFDSNGVQHDVVKFYMTDIESASLVSSRGQQFHTDENGWVIAGATAGQTDQKNENDADPF